MEVIRRGMYPTDIHSEVSLSNRSSNSGKSIIIRVILIAMVLGCAVGGNILLSRFGVPFLGIILGLIVGVLIALLVWNYFTNKEEAAIENPEDNKALKFFKISLGSEEYLDDAPVIEYSNGDKAVILSLSMGNQTHSGEVITEEFLDDLFHMCHKQNIKFRIFTTIEEWEDSEMHESLLETYGKIRDKKLKSHLFESILSQSIDFGKSKIFQINIIFTDNTYNLNKLKSVVDFIASFKETGVKLSSFRSVRWNTQSKAVSLFCSFLGTKLIDSSPLADKNAVYLDTKVLIRPFLLDEFFASNKLTKHLTNTMAIKSRTPKIKKGGAHL